MWGASTLGSHATKKVSVMMPSGKNEAHTVGITALLGIEENYWSPKYGIKGKVDVTFEAQDESGHRSVVPLEFKSGREGLSHVAQLIL